MSENTPPTPKTQKIGFSRQFDAAMIETRMIDALIKADGWSLAEFTHAPPWLRQLYTSHAVAACMEMLEIERAESILKPSDHK